MKPSQNMGVAMMMAAHIEVSDMGLLPPRAMMTR